VNEIVARLYVCPECPYRTRYRWVLVRHLFTVHAYNQGKAKLTASKSEYLINPLSYRQINKESIPYHQQTTKEDPMRKLRRLSRILADLDERDIDSDDVVVDPKSVHVVSDDDEEVEEEED